MSTTLDYWETRLQNWALWYVSGSRLGISAYDGMWDDGAPRPPPPLVGEALDTDTLLGKLNAISPDQYNAVRVKYCWTGSEESKALALRIPWNTLNQRVKAAKFKLDDLYHASRFKRGDAMALMI